LAHYDRPPANSFNVKTRRAAMLGEQIGAERGKVTGYRILKSDAGPLVEVSFQARGTILGIEHATLATYVSRMRPDGTVIGEGQGVVRGADGHMASWVGQGVGKLGSHGQAVSYRGATFYQSASPGWSRLNGVATVFEFEVDADGNTEAKLWEWK
jgi:hypothetical protein